MKDFSSTEMKFRHEIFDFLSYTSRNEGNYVQRVDGTGVVHRL